MGFQETLQSLSKEDFNGFICCFEKLVQESVIDINSDSEKIHVILLVLNILVDMEFDRSKTIRILEPVHGKISQNYIRYNNILHKYNNILL